jgi:hypothetical protein
LQSTRPIFRPLDSSQTPIRGETFDSIVIGSLLLVGGKQG